MSRRILLADDSVTIQKVIELTFMDGDYEVRAVGSGDDAIALLETVDPDVVITDVHMPGASNGYEVARRAKALRRDRPVLLLVGTFEPFDEAEARACGADRHLKKPFDSQELLQVVDDLIASGGAPALLAAAPPTLADDPFPGLAAFGSLAPAAPVAAPAAADPFAGFSLGSATPADPIPGFSDSFAASAPTAPPAETVFSFADDPPPGIEPAYLPPAEPVWSTFEVEPEDAVLPALDEADLGLRVEPEPIFDLGAEEAMPLFPQVPEPEPEPIAPPAWDPSAAPIAAAPLSTAVPATPSAAPEPPWVAAPVALAADFSLSEADVDRIARRVVELIGDRPVRDVAWEVIPDLAEVVIRDRIRELEAAVDA